MIKILVVDDSLTMRRTMVDILDKDPGFDVVGEAANGKEAIHMAQAFSPDVISMDMMMPEMNGVAATEYIMAHCPTRIMILSSSLNRGELMKTYDALAAGAISAFEKPSGVEDIDDWEEKVVEELKLVSRIPVIHHIRAKKQSLPKPPLSMPELVKTKYEMVVMGASTGGPQAMMGILQGLPSNFSIPVICVLHISQNFSGSLAEWFSNNTALNVKFATDRMFTGSLGKGLAVLAPADYHLTIENSMLKIVQTPLVNYCRPSVDVLFESAAKNIKDKAIGILLTGIGTDGASGLKQMHDAGAYTIAQDEASSVVYGMNKAAIDMGAAKKVLPYQDIASELIRLCE